VKRGVALAALVFGTSGCWLALGLDDNEYGGPSPAPTGEMVEVSLEGAPTFFIDPTEVTMRKYIDWVEAAPSLDNQDARCSWNDSYMPGEGSAGVVDGCITDPVGAASLYPNHPARCVDWCDAFAYCRARGQVLCGTTAGGSITGDGGPVIDAFNDPAVSAWFAACTGGDPGRLFPYGATADDAACQDGLAGPALTEAGNVGAASCEGGVPGLFDMSGNVEEWIDACFNSGDGNPALDTCFLGGGRFDYAMAEDLDCPNDGATSNSRSSQTAGAGFRCCRGN
jgi:formylglycine-generating enzyme required for sulfatase activity